MKKAVLLIILSVFSLVSLAQEAVLTKPLGWKLLREIDKKATISLPAIDVAALKEEDKINDHLPMPWRFGYKHLVNYGLSDGSWEELDNGDRIWRIKFIAKKALSLNVIFDSFYIPENGVLFLYNEEHTALLGSYTAEQNSTSERFGTWLLTSDNMIIEYYEPKAVKGLVKLNIEAVTQGYRNAKSFNEEKALNSSAYCNLDVDCSIGGDWDPIKEVNKKSVGILLSGGSGFCSGALVNNTSNDGKPYFLTAEHCYSDPSTWSVLFEWISPNPVCAVALPSQDGPTLKTLNGATLRAKNTATDFCLVELNSPIPPAWNLSWAGWDKTDDMPTYAVGIHHPAGDVMKVCRDDTGPIKAVNAGAQTWEVTTAGGGWEMGVTEGGSSGSPLFDQEGRIIGQLYGGGAACSGLTDNGALDYYGRFAVSWDGASAATRLKDWLDPANLNVSTLDPYPPLIVYGLDASVYVTFPEEVCAATTTNAAITLKNSGSTTLTSATIVWSLNSGANTTINWTGSLAQNQIEEIQLGSLTSPNGVFTVTVSSSLPNGGIDEYTNNDTSTRTFTLSSNRFGTTKVFLDLLTDNYAQETSWKFRKSDGTILKVGGAFLAGNTHYLDTFVVATNECYEFEIYDTQYDGICCYYGNGSYKLTTDNGTTIAQGGAFVSSELTKFTITGTTNINQVAQHEIEVFPNPTSDILTIQLGSLTERVDFEIISSFGQLMLKGELDATKTLDLAHLSKGVYFLKIVSNNEILKVQKIIKN